METYLDLLNKINKLKQKANDLNEELFYKQRNFITKKFRELLDMPDCSEASIWAVIIFILPFRYCYLISYYTKESDRNTLLKEKLINRFAREQGIRYEDSLNVITEFMYIMKPINYNQLNDKIIPIFYK